MTIEIGKKLGRGAGLLDELYGRLGPRYPWALVALAFGLGALTMAVGTAVVAAYVDGSLGELVGLFLVGWIGSIIAGAITLWRWHPTVRGIERWITTDRPSDTVVDLWRAVVRMPMSIPAFSLPFAALLIAVPFAGYASLTFGISLGNATVLLGLLLVGGLYGYLFLYFLIETCLRPVVRDLAAHAPKGFAIASTEQPLARKLLASLLVANLGTGVFVGVTLSAIHDSFRDLALGLAATMLASGVTFVIVVLITESLRLPLRELLDGTVRVRGGDLNARVPILSQDEIALLASAFNEMTVGLDETEQELRSSRERIVTTADTERRRLERDLHDGAQQHLVLLGMKLALAERMIDRDPSAARATHAELRTDLNTALKELRDLAHGIYPAVLENEGLPVALQDAVQRAAIPTTVESDGTKRYRPELEAAVYFCCLEALQNAAKHAGDNATATLSLTERDGSLIFAIADDGAGFEPTLAHGRSGLQNMADRIGALGGTLTIDSQPGTGTEIVGSIQLDP